MPSGTPRAIILDEAYSKGLLRAALREGYADLIDSSEEIIKEYKGQGYTGRALAFAVLYPEIYLYHLCDAVDLSRLGKYMSIEMLTPKSVEIDSYSYLHSELGYRQALHMMPIVIPRCQHLSQDSEGAFRVNKTNYPIFLSAFRRCDEVYKLMNDSSLLEHMYRSYSAELGISRNRLQQQMDALPNKEASMKVKASMALKTLAVSADIADTVRDTIGLAEFSGRLKCPSAISWSIPANVRRLEYWQPIESCPKATMRCFYIFLEEVDAFPVISSIDDVLRLRDDSRIVNWRNAINEWALAIRSSSVVGEHKMRRDIKAAMRDLKRVKKIRRVSGLLTMFSLPLSVAEAMSGVLGPGIVLSGLFTAAEVYTENREKNLEWMFFGKGI